MFQTIYFSPEIYLEHQLLADIFLTTYNTIIIKAWGTLQIIFVKKHLKYDFSICHTQGLSMFRGLISIGNKGLWRTETTQSTQYITDTSTKNELLRYYF